MHAMSPFPFSLLHHPSPRSLPLHRPSSRPLHSLSPRTLHFPLPLLPYPPHRHPYPHSQSQSLLLHSIAPHALPVPVPVPNSNSPSQPPPPLQFPVLTLLKSFLPIAALCALLLPCCPTAIAADTNSLISSGQSALAAARPKIMMALQVLREHGLVLAALLGLSAFFSMAETAITTLWPWKVRELAEKEPENGVFRMLRGDVTRFLTTILIGTTVVNIGATALVTEAATAILGEAGVSTATGVMTVLVLLLTEITPKSLAVHNATEVARFVVRPVAWLSLVLYPVGRVVSFISMGILKMLGLKGRR